MQYRIILFPKEWKGQRSVKNWVASRDKTICHNEVCMGGSECLKSAEPVLMQTGKDAHQHPQMNKIWSVLKQ